jgi:uncharacterized protein YjbI with pentapeptide repeats
MPFIETGSIHEEKEFEGLKSNGATIEGSTFLDCSFVNCSLVEVILQSCRFQRCKFLACDMSLLEIPGSEFQSVIFEESKLVGVNWTKAKIDLPALGKPHHFRSSMLNHSTFLNLDLQGLRMIECTAHEVDFREANLSEAVFSHTDLQGSLFMSTNLEAADFRLARNYDINPAKNNLSRAHFSLPEAMSLLYALDINLEEAEESF